MMPYAAYLRIYEPLSAFPEPDRTRWAAYATSTARSRRMSALAEEYAEALRRVAAVPPVLIPERESEHAYVRWLEGVTYVCPWQTRLRSWLALGELRATAEPPFADAFAPQQAVEAAAAFTREWASDRVHIRTNTWTVPITWFVPFAATERRTARGGHRPSEGFRRAWWPAERRTGHRGRGGHPPRMAEPWGRPPWCIRHVYDHALAGQAPGDQVAGRGPWRDPSATREPGAAASGGARSRGRAHRS